MSTALILVDIQNDYFPGGTMELVGMDAAAAEARTTLNDFRAAGLPLFHIKHLAVQPNPTFFVPGTDGAEHHASVKPQDGETVIEKNFPSSFRNTDLEEQLRDGGITDLVIVGAMSHMCIDATTRAAFDLGFNCTVLQDACATRDLEFNEVPIPALQVHGAFMAALSRPYAAVMERASLTIPGT